MTATNGRTDEDFRPLLDAHGILRPGALEPPARTEAFTIFAQRTDARLDFGSLERQAKQFFKTRVGLVVDKRYVVDAGPPERDAARIVIAPDKGSPGTRLAFGRPREHDDLEIAERADARVGSPGMGLLARRCKYVWLVVLESDPDPLALVLAALLASVLLGPILAPSQDEVFGVRTARLKLEQALAPAPGQR